jgi:hypothetical protein
MDRLDPSPAGRAAVKAILDLSLEDRRLACEKVEAEMRLPATSVEKDFWVCWALREIVRLPDIGDHLTFKGGTSLSKGWGLIERFSEDIDIVVDRGMLGFGGDASPEKAPSKKQRGKRLDALRDKCREWVQGPLKNALGEKINAALGADGWKLEVDAGVQDGQCLLFHYPSAFAADEDAYVARWVKIEMGARSDDWPEEDRDIRPYLAQHVEVLAEDASFPVATLKAERTFWEKAMLLHEETFRPADKPRALRMARHYYDLHCLIRSGVADRAAADKDLFQRCAEHRQVFFGQNWVDYDTLKPGTLRVSPADAHLADWRRDYEQMQGPMFFGESPAFGDILASVADFQQRFNAAHSS